MVSTPVLVVPSGMPSADGKYHLRYQDGTAPNIGAVLTAAPASNSVASASLTTGGSTNPLQPSDLTYLGAFATPQTQYFADMGGIDRNGGASLSFNPTGNGGAGSIWVSNSYFIAEIAPVTGANLKNPNTVGVGSLSVCTVLQSSANGLNSDMPKDATGTNPYEWFNYNGGVNNPNGINPDSSGGVAYMAAMGSQTSAKLYFGGFVYYDVTGTDYPSLCWCDVNLTTPNGQGLWHVGPLASTDDPSTPFESAYHGAKSGDCIFAIDQTWANTHTGGRSLIVCRARESGTNGSSMGPALIACGPWLDGNPPAPGANLSAIALMRSYCDQSNPALWRNCAYTSDPAWPYYSPQDRFYDGAWVTSSTGKTAVILAGRKSCFTNNPAQPQYNPNSYPTVVPGGSDGSHGGFVSDLDPSGNPTTYPYCYGTGGQECAGAIAVNSDKGYHAGPYESRLFFIDPADLAAVAAGTKSSYAVSINLSHDPTADWTSVDGTDVGNGVCGITFDPVRRLLYVAQTGANRPGGFPNTPYPVIHVYQVS